ncbi:MAG: type II secretion system F family protein [Candidatus Anstonellales archaeon]
MIRLPIISKISDLLLPYYPDLRKKLIAAESVFTPEQYFDNVIFVSFIMSLFISAVAGLFLWSYSVITSESLMLIVFSVLFVFLFIIFYFVSINSVDVLLLRRKKEIDYDLVFAVKHLIISLSSGSTLFDAMVGLTKGYGRVSKEFKRIVERVSLGEPLTFVLRDAAEKTPSSALKRVLIQLANAVVSGADIAASLNAVVNQISKEQFLEIKEYGQKLNPLVMFYLIIGVILPALGIVFLMVFLSFSPQTGLSMPFVYLLGVAVVLALIQFLFLAAVDSTRPRYAIMD